MCLARTTRTDAALLSRDALPVYEGRTLNEPGGMCRWKRRWAILPKPATSLSSASSSWLIRFSFCAAVTHLMSRNQRHCKSFDSLAG